MSTTSDEYECYSCHYEDYYTSPGMSRTPFYPTMADPYVYFAHVPSGQNTKKGRKTSPNCFVKAFRWYTQEHIPQPEVTTMSPKDPNVTGFATWLDCKYEEYLRDSGRCPSPYCRDYTIMPTQTSIIETSRVNGEPCQPCTATRFRLKSPWRKRRYCNNTVATDVECKVEGSVNRSLVYILEPKELTRPVSDCCHPAQTPCCSQFDICKKSVVKSQSATSFPRERDSSGPPVDTTVPAAEGEKKKKNNKPVKKEKKGNKTEGKPAKKVVESPVECECHKNPPEPTSKPELKSIDCQCSLVKPSLPVTKPQNNDIECQCISSQLMKNPVEPHRLSFQDTSAPPARKPMETQYRECCPRQIVCPNCGLKIVDNGRRPSLISTQTAVKSTNRKLSIKESEGNPPVVNKTVESTVKVAQQITETCQCKEPVCCNCTDPQPYYCNGLLYCENINNKKVVLSEENRDDRENLKCDNASCLTCPPLAMCMSVNTNTCTKLLVSDTAQTSDHSICLENTINGYPLFMRIVCADKLNDECVCKQKTCI